MADRSSTMRPPAPAFATGMNSRQNSLFMGGVPPPPGMGGGPPGSALGSRMPSSMFPLGGGPSQNFMMGPPPPGLGAAVAAGGGSNPGTPGTNLSSGSGSAGGGGGAMANGNYQNLFVSGLPQYVTDEILYTVFAEYGSIKSAKVMLDTTTGVSRGFGFVLFESQQEGCRAYGTLHNQMAKLEDGREFRIHAAPSQHDGKSAAVESPIIYVRNIPSTVSEERIQNYFADIGSVVACTVRNDNNSSEYRLATVEFKTVTQARDAINRTHTNKNVFPESGDRPLLAKFADSSQMKHERSKKKEEQWQHRWGGAGGMPFVSPGSGGGMPNASGSPGTLGGAVFPGAVPLTPPGAMGGNPYFSPVPLPVPGGGGAMNGSTTSVPGGNNSMNNSGTNNTTGGATVVGNNNYTSTGSPSEPNNNNGVTNNNTQPAGNQQNSAITSPAPQQNGMASSVPALSSSAIGASMAASNLAASPSQPPPPNTNSPQPQQQQQSSSSGTTGLEATRQQLPDYVPLPLEPRGGFQQILFQGVLGLTPEGRLYPIRVEQCSYLPTVPGGAPVFAPPPPTNPNNNSSGQQQQVAAATPTSAFGATPPTASNNPSILGNPAANAFVGGSASQPVPTAQHQPPSVGGSFSGALGGSVHGPVGSAVGVGSLSATPARNSTQVVSTDVERLLGDLSGHPPSTGHSQPTELET